MLRSVIVLFDQISYELLTILKDHNSGSNFLSADKSGAGLPAAYLNLVESFQAAPRMALATTSGLTMVL